jgi:hypothetical protein
MHLIACSSPAGDVWVDLIVWLAVACFNLLVGFYIGWVIVPQVRACLPAPCCDHIEWLPSPPVRIDPHAQGLCLLYLLSHVLPTRSTPCCPPRPPSALRPSTTCSSGPRWRRRSTSTEWQGRCKDDTLLLSIAKGADLQPQHGLNSCESRSHTLIAAGLLHMFSTRPTMLTPPTRRPGAGTAASSTST